MIVDVFPPIFFFFRLKFSYIKCGTLTTSSVNGKRQISVFLFTSFVFFFFAQHLSILFFALFFMLSPLLCFSFSLLFILHAVPLPPFSFFVVCVFLLFFFHCYSNTHNILRLYRAYSTVFNILHIFNFKKKKKSLKSIFHILMYFKISKYSNIH